MKTRRNLAPDQPLLVGRLTAPDGPSRPTLGIAVWCPWCKRHHHHGWTSTDRLASAEVAYRAAHCGEGSPLRATGYWIGLDPAAAAENRRAFAEYRAMVEAWEARRRRMAS